MNEPVPNARLAWPMRLAGALPLGLLRWLGSGLGLLVYLASGSYRRKIRDNLRTAGLDTPEMRRAAAVEAGRALAELPFIWSRSPEQLLALVRCDTMTVLDRAEEAGQGLLLITLHLGGFEVGARVYAARALLAGGKMIVLYKPPTKKWMRPLVRSSRAAPGFEALPADVAGVRAMLRALRSRGAVALLPDQVPSATDGRWAPFFGRPAYTSTLPQRLVERTGAKVVLGICERLPAGRGWELRLEEIVASPSPELLNACFEQAIRRRPEQYLWGYSRYKAPASVARGGAPQPDSQRD